MSFTTYLDPLNTIASASRPPPDPSFASLSFGQHAKLGHSHRSSYHSRHRSPSPDVIAGLLASFPSISAPQHEQTYPVLDVFDTGVAATKSSRTSISTFYPRRSRPTTRPASVDYRAPSLTASSADPDAAAQPPVVRTGRPDTLTPRFRLRKSTDNPRDQRPATPQVYPPQPNVHPALRRQSILGTDGAQDQLSPLPSTFGDVAPPRLSDLLGSRPSNDSKRSMDSGSRASKRESWAKSIRRGSFLRAVNGKDRDFPSLRTSQGTSNVGDVAAFSSPLSRSSTWGQPEAGAAVMPALSPPALDYPLDLCINGVVSRPVSRDSSDDEFRNAMDSRMPVPDRVSSLRHRHLENRPRSRRKLQRTNAHAKSDDEAPPEATLRAEANESSQQRHNYHSADDLESDAEDEVQRRIKQLKAAQEERRQRDLTRSSISRSPPSELTRLYRPHPAHGEPPVPPLPTSGPDTARASLQLVRAAHIREHRLVNDDLPNGIYRTVSISPAVKLGFIPTTPKTPTSPTSPSSLQPQAKTYINFSLNRPTPVTSGQSTPRQSLQIVRTDYSAQRWATPYDTPRRSISAQPTDVVYHQHLPLADPRASIDSVDDSVRDFLSAPRLSRFLYRPQERRRIAYSEVGDPRGHVVFCCVGMGLTRYISAFYDELAASLRLRIITLDRPGIGDSDAYADDSRTPLSWPDDIQAVCEHLDIYRFSLLAHSAGAIYALATALRMPHRLAGRLHLLAPWIPPSQLPLLSSFPASPGTKGASAGSSSPALPRSQRFLRILPTPFLRLGNAAFLQGGLRGGGGGSTTSSPAAGRHTQSSGRARKSGDGYSAQASPRSSTNGPPPATLPRGFQPSLDAAGAPLFSDIDVHVPSDHSITGAVLLAGGAAVSSVPLPPSPSKSTRRAASAGTALARQRRYDAALTPALWTLATRAANPAVDLLVCLERRRNIGFAYPDAGVAATSASAAGGLCVRHGSRDARVPLENVRRLGRAMEKAGARCEVRVLEGEGHGLMSVAGVVGAVLTEIAKEAAAAAATGVAMGGR